MVDHFREYVLAPGRIGGRARGMVVCANIARTIDTFHAIKAYLHELKDPFAAIVAFSGEPEYGGRR